MSETEESSADPLDREAHRKEEILQQTNKRLTLNLLIQGAAMHSFVTSHHLVRDELGTIDPGLMKLYDKLSLNGALNYFIGDLVLLFGLPSRFWNRVHRASNPFHQHRLFVTHGRTLWKESKRYLLKRGWKKGVICIPVLNSIQTLWLLLRILIKESRCKEQLVRVAKRANALIWGIGEDRLDGALTFDVAFGNIRRAETYTGRMLQSCNGIAGYGGVEYRDGQFLVLAKACCWPLLSHELTKGIVELICLHGLNSLDEEMYEAVMHKADHLEYETWMLQAGGEMWRRLLTAMPEGKKLPETLMHLARLPPLPLEEIMMAVVEDPDKARLMLDELDHRNN